MSETARFFMPTKQIKTKVTIDFETRSTVNLKNYGQWAYSLHPDTEVLCICFKRNDGIVYSTEGPFFEPTQRVLNLLQSLAKDPGCIFEAHNAGFEYAIWQNIMADRYWLPEIPPERWRCSAAVASYKSMPRALGKLAAALGSEHQKDEDGKRVMMKMTKPVTEKHRHLHGFWHEDPEDWERLISYCEDDVRTEHACSEILGVLPKNELKLWMLDFKINHTGIHVDHPFIKAAQKMKEEIKKDLTKESKRLCGYTPGQVQKLKAWMKEHGVEIPTKKNKDGVEKETLGAQVLKKMVIEPSTPEIVKKVIRVRQDFSTTSLSKLDKALSFSDEHNVIRDQFMYHGATTGRWTGKGVQFHNLPRGLFDEETVASDIIECCHAVMRGDLAYLENWYGDIGTAMGIMKSCLRGMVIPRDGCVLRVMDFSQIEARVLPWLAGQQEVLDAFIQGKDLYKFVASQIFNKPYDEITKEERFIGKTAALALGYQGGAGAFVSMALNFGVLVEKKRAEEIKRYWREQNKRIVKFWYDLERAAVRTVLSGKPTGVHQKIQFRMKDEYLTMVLPSKRRLWYYQPKVKERVIETATKGKYRKAGLTYMGSDSARGIQWGRVHTYGGKLAENATQAASRDLLSDAMTTLDAHGYTPVIHVHDEIVTEDRPDRGSLKDMKRLMLQSPDWAEGLPVDADGFECNRYYKG